MRAAAAVRAVATAAVVAVVVAAAAVVAVEMEAAYPMLKSGPKPPWSSSPVWL